MSAELPPGQGPIDPRGAFNPPPPPTGAPSPHTPPPPPWPGQAPPYPMPMMMPMWPPPAPPRPQKTFVRAIFLTLATTIFSLSLLANLYLLMWAGIAGSSGAAQSNAIVAGDPKQTIAVVPVTGAIDGETFQRFDALLRQVEADPNVKALVIEIDTPGGEVTASDEIHHRLRQYRDEHPGVPVISAMRQLATSGGYYVACGTEYIVAQPSTMTGNIGVLMMRFNVAKLMEKWGVVDATMHSTGSDFKDAGSMFKPETPEERAYIQELLDQAFAQFKDAVKTARGDRLKAPLDEVANGKVYLADAAWKLGLVDQVGYADDAYAIAAARAGNLSDPHVVRFKPPAGILQMLGVRSEYKGDGVRVRLDPGLLDRIAAPRMMYLWQAP